jgi:hypothetical protein
MESLSFIMGLIYWKKVKTTFWVWFVVYLGFITVGEWVSYYLSHFTIYKNAVNEIGVYILIPMEFLFLYWLYYKQALKKRSKLLVVLCAFVYIVGFFIDRYYFQGKSFIFDSFSYSLGNLLLLIIILSFLIQFSKGDEILQYSSSLIFCVSVGALIFYLGTLPYFGLFHLLYDRYRNIFHYYTYLFFFLDWMMYLLFIIGFIKWKPK